MKRLLVLLIVLLHAGLAVVWLWPNGDEPGLVRKGVILEGREVMGWTEDEVLELVDHLARDIELDPADAYYDESSLGVVPGYPGIWVNRDLTVERVMEASPDSSLNLVLTCRSPDRTIDDFSAPAIYHGHPERPEIGLLINVAWGSEHLEPLLTVLDLHHARATFSVMGKWLEQNPDWGRAIVERGHELANHGYRDLHPGQLGQNELREELESTSRLMQDLGLGRPRVYTPHYGERTDHILHAASEAGMVTVYWSVDTLDWTGPQSGEIAARVERLVHPGAIILLHPTRQAVGALEKILPVFSQRALKPVTLSQLLWGPWDSR